MSIFSTRIERHVLGGIINHPRVFTDIDGIIKENHFYNDVHYTIFCALKNCIYNSEVNLMDSSGSKIDEVMLATKIKNLGVSFKDDINIYDYISSLAFTEITQQATIEACKELIKITVRREIDSTAEKISKTVKESSEKPIDEIIASCDSLYHSRISSYRLEVEPQKISDGLRDLVYERAESPIEDSGLLTPHAEFNRCYGGMKAGHVYAIASRPGEGKTTWMVDCAYKMAGINKIKVLYLDTEMSTEEIKFRLAASLTGVNPWYLETGNWTKNPELIENVQNADLNVNSDFYHLHVADMTVDEICSTAKRWYYTMVGRGEPCLLVYDYVKLTGEKINKNQAEYQIIGEKINALKRIGEEIDAPVLTAVQLNRSGESRNRQASDITDDSSAFALSDRLQWIAAFTAIFRRKTIDEVAMDGEESGTHKLIPTKERFQGQHAAGHRSFLRRRFPNGTEKFVPNFLNFEISNFNVEERGGLRHIIEREDQSHEDVNPNERDGDDRL